jgi:hypothetical protein
MFTGGGRIQDGLGTYLGFVGAEGWMWLQGQSLVSPAWQLQGSQTFQVEATSPTEIFLGDLVEVAGILVLE